MNRTLARISVLVLAACSSPEEPVTDPPVELDDTPGMWKAVSAGDGQTCGITKSDILYCWGKNDVGQLGDGTRTPHPTPQPILSESTFAIVKAGPGSSCGTTPSGAAYCWGIVANSIQPTPVLMDPQRRFTALAPGTWMICGLSIDQHVYCWSLSVPDAPDAVALPGARRFVTLVNDANLFCGVSTDTRVYCWEPDDFGRPSTPFLRGNSHAALSVAVASTGYFPSDPNHLCTIAANTGTYCWGANSFGQLGLGDETPRDSPTLLTSHRFAHISASFTSTCGVAVNGIPYCWGTILHTGPVRRQSAIPEALLPGVRAATASVGPDHYCFLTVGGAGFCGGHNGAGQLGAGASFDGWQEPQRVIDPQ